ncbi:MAG: hypothetical protein Fur0010_08950 [Bdellovibrio sp.]
MKFLLIFSFFIFNANATEFVVKTSDKSRYTNVIREFELLGERYIVVSGAAPKAFGGDVVDENFEITTFHHGKADALMDKGVSDYSALQWGIENRGNNEPINLNRRSPVNGVVGADANVRGAWTKVEGDKDIVVAVVDTGVEISHSDLVGNIWVNEAEMNGVVGVDDDGNGYIDDVNGYDFVAKSSKIIDQMGHGTHVAGIIGARHNNLGVNGVMKNVSLMSVRFLDKKGRGDLEGSLKAMAYAIENGAHVINCSWGSGRFSQLMLDLIEKARTRGAVVVAAAGNLRGRNNDTDPTYPANYDLDNVISISAHNAQNYHTAFSTFGPQTVHIAAPGENIVSTFIGNDFKVWSGTSMAAPYVSGAIGLWMSLHGASMTNARSLLIDSVTLVDHIAGKNVSGGRLNTLKLLKF